LRIVGEGIDRTVALRSLQWPERTRHGVRIAHLDGGGSVQSTDSAAWDAWSHAAGLSDSLVVRLQQSWRGVVVSVLLLVTLIVALQQWGVPVAARAIVALIPHTVDTAIGDYTQSAVDEQLMKLSALPEHRAQQLREALAKAVAGMPADSVPQWQLLLRASKMGANALALPNGTIILTDDMVEMVDANVDVLVGVLAHELGHVQQRHGMRMLVQVTALGALASTVLGDFSSLLASVPVLMGQASYSRQAEQEADAFAVDVLRHAGLSPMVMVTMFDKLGAWRERKEQEVRDKLKIGTKGASSTPPGTAHTEPKDKASRKAEEDSQSWLGIAFASHPADAQRVQFFQDAARSKAH
jgi:Zn-dependent protease with chaperone function